jgi:hypothetical protein
MKNWKELPTENRAQRRKKWSAVTSKKAFVSNDKASHYFGKTLFLGA